MEGCRDPQFLFNLSQGLFGSITTAGTEARSLGTNVAEIREELLKVVYEIERSSFPEPYPYYFLADMARETPETFLVAISGCDVAGYVLTSVNRDVGHVLSIAVLENFRRKGIGSSLMNRMEEALRRKGVLRIDLEVRKSNLAAHAFYQKLGFQETGLVNAYYRDGEDAVGMTKTLE